MCLHRRRLAFALLGMALAAQSVCIGENGEQLDPLHRLPPDLPPLSAVQDAGTLSEACAGARGDRVVSVADLHGDFVGMLTLLQRLCLVREGVTSDPNTWTNLWVGGRATFIQLGDVNDRGHYGHIIWKFLWVLQDERKDGKVVLRLGNHESHPLTGHFFPRTRQDLCTYASNFSRCVGDPSAEQACLDGRPGRAAECYKWAWYGQGLEGGPDTMFGQVIARLKDGRMKVAHKEGRTLFVHAGWTLRTTESLKQTQHLKVESGDMLVNELNSLALRVLSMDNLGLAPFMFSADSESGMDKGSPTWTRRYQHEEGAVCVEALNVLKTLGASRMVKGHDIQTDGIAKVHCGGAVLLTDTSMSVGYTGSREQSNRNLMALETSIEGTDAWFIYPMRQAGQQRVDATWPRAEFNEASTKQYTCCVITVPGRIAAERFWVEVRDFEDFLGVYEAGDLGSDNEFIQRLKYMHYRQRCLDSSDMLPVDMISQASTIDTINRNADLSWGCDDSTEVLVDDDPIDAQQRNINDEGDADVGTQWTNHRLSILLDGGLGTDEDGDFLGFHPPPPLL
eukprot:CAMPEP_0198531312 /NCGR_PEP_ID=MMETSP1462-20131121/26865_1 /TAXON_ID=1333877 /ORGANISM="Brandtodinium nutriculum, Strain RCC3387" /LENGTH=564 /DNA_ID=CAMNT_0044261203 /DNA_START=20 /DNA_END=1711 /DNA_ORIENTATION=-